VLCDAIARAEAHYECPTSLTDVTESSAGIVEWAQLHRLTEVVAFAPTVGPIRDLVPHLSERLAEMDIRLTFIRRDSDAQAFRMATTGFFPFWEKMSRHLRAVTAV
jgi:hypothetical protein